MAEAAPSNGPVVDRAIRLANEIAKFSRPTFEQLDAERFLEAYRAANVSALDEPTFKKIFLDLGWDTAPAAPPAPGEGEAPAAEEGGEESAAAEEQAAPAEPTHHAEAYWAALNGPNAAQVATGPAGSDFASGGSGGSLSGAWIAATLFLVKNGFGDATLRFALKAWDTEGKGELGEQHVWLALLRAATADLTPDVRGNLRKVWRQAREKWEEAAKAAAEAAAEAGGDAAAEAEPEAGADGVEAGEGGSRSAPPPPPAPSGPRVSVEEFLGLLAADERLTALVAPAEPIALPIEEPPVEAEAE